MKNQSIRAVWICSIFLVLGGCVSAKFTKTGVYKSEPRARDCSISIFTAIPKNNYKEIGFIEFQGGAVGMRTAKNLASEYVCANGGNAILLLGADSDGAFNSATVLHVESEQK